MILGCSSLATPNLLSLNRARHVRWRCHLEFLPAFEQKRGDLQGDYLDYLAPGALASPEGRASGECYSAATVAGELWFSPKSGNVGVSGNARYAIVVDAAVAHVDGVSTRRTRFRTSQITAWAHRVGAEAMLRADRVA